MGNLPLSYNVAIESVDGQVLVDWGNEKNWQETHRELLNSAHRISLIPKNKVHDQPVVSIVLDGEKRWVIFSRVYGHVAGGNGREIRMYCIGWQKTIRGVNEKSLLWVYPSGAVECAEQPTMIDHFLEGFSNK